MFLRSQGNKTKLLANLKNILFQNKSSSVDYFAIDYSVKTAINMNKNLILEQAFQEKFQNTYSNSSQVDLPQISLMNEMDHSGFDKLQIDIMNFFQKIIDKKSVTEGELLDLEKEKFLQLAATPISLERISKFV
jgi:3-hydroxyacyl-CoA dehydrogenase/enoyl-CoA hydratase/3-hydroxybutyryl-CoA epimerase